jgi:hypothetical protein
MTQGNSRGATSVMPGTADASAYVPLRQPAFRALSPRRLNGAFRREHSAISYTSLHSRITNAFSDIG